MAAQSEGPVGVETPLPGEAQTRGGPAEVYASAPSWRKTWWVVTAVSWTLLIIVTVILGRVGTTTDDPWRVFYVAGVLGLVVLARSRWFHRSPPESGSWEDLIRQCVPIVAMLVAIGLFVVWYFNDQADGWFFAAASALLLGLSQLVSEVRLRRGSESKAAWLAKFLAVPLVVGVLGMFTGMSTADIVATVLGVLGLAVVMGLVAERAIVREEAVLSGRVTGAWRPVAVAVMFVVAVVWLLVLDVPGWAVLVLLAALCGLVATIVTNTDLDAVAGIAILAFGLALTPSIASEDQEPTFDDGDELLVAFGDSYMSGEGAEEYLDGTNDPSGNHCRRAATAYPIVAVTEELPGMPESVLTVACSGAKAFQVYQDPQNADEPLGDDEDDDGRTQVDNLAWQLRNRDADIDLVAVSIGGNDAGFGIIGPTCVAPGDCTDVAQGWFDNLSDVGDAVAAAYAEIDRVVGELTADDADGPPSVVVVPYPKPFGSSDCREVPLTSRERTTLTHFVEELNDVLQQEAETAGFDYLAGMEDVLVDNGLALCDRGVRGLNFLGFSSVDGSLFERINPTNWIHNSFHPNVHGHAEMAEVLSEYAAGEADEAGPPTVDEPFELSEVYTGETFEHCGEEVADTEDLALECDPDRWWHGKALGAFLWALVPLLLTITASWFLWVAIARARRNSIAPG